jgi:hypothetical protein
MENMEDFCVRHNYTQRNLLLLLQQQQQQPYTLTPGQQQQQQQPPPSSSSAAAATAAIALKFHPKHEKQQNLRQNEIHYENITH